MAAYDHKILAEMSGVTTAGTTIAIFQNGSGVTSFVRQIWLHVPYDGCLDYSETSVKLFAVPDSATALGKPCVTNQFFTKSLVTNETFIIDCGVPGIIFGDQNDSIQIWHLNSGDVAGGGTTIGYMVMGGEER